MKWPTNKEKHAYMKMRQQQNIDESRDNPNEKWMLSHLATTGYKWRRQAQWGYRLFDFWCAKLGIAVEVDGKTHDPEYDAVRDRYNYSCSGILVLRVRNRNESDAQKALETIRTAESWNYRRSKLGLKPIKGMD